jgi:hypothetical protein
MAPQPLAMAQLTVARYANVVARADVAERWEMMLRSSHASRLPAGDGSGGRGKSFPDRSLQIMSHAPRCRVAEASQQPLRAAIRLSDPG